MVVGYMGGTKRARQKSSIANRTTIFGLMGGLAPKVGKPVSWNSQLQKKATNYLEIPLKPAAGLAYMKGDNPQGRYMLSKNPAGSGGVGRGQFTHVRCTGSCPDPETDVNATSIGVGIANLRNAVAAATAAGGWTNTNYVTYLTSVGFYDLFNTNAVFDYASDDSSNTNQGTFTSVSTAQTDHPMLMLLHNIDYASDIVYEDSDVSQINDGLVYSVSTPYTSTSAGDATLYSYVTFNDVGEIIGVTTVTDTDTFNLTGTSSGLATPLVFIGTNPVPTDPAVLNTFTGGGTNCRMFQDFIAIEVSGEPDTWFSGTTNLIDYAYWNYPAPDPYNDSPDTQTGAPRLNIKATGVVVDGGVDDGDDYFATSQEGVDGRPRFQIFGTNSGTMSLYMYPPSGSGNGGGFAGTNIGLPASRTSNSCAFWQDFIATGDADCNSVERGHLAGMTVEIISAREIPITQYFGSSTVNGIYLTQEYGGAIWLRTDTALSYIKFTMEGVTDLVAISDQYQFPNWRDTTSPYTLYYTTCILGTNQTNSSGLDQWSATTTVNSTSTTVELRQVGTTGSTVGTQINACCRIIAYGAKDMDGGGFIDNGTGGTGTETAPFFFNEQTATNYTLDEVRDAGGTTISSWGGVWGGTYGKN